MIKPTEKFDDSEPIINIKKLGLIRLPVFNIVFSVNKKINHFFCASADLDNGVSSPSKTYKTDTNTTILSTFKSVHMKLLIKQK